MAACRCSATCLGEFMKLGIVVAIALAAVPVVPAFAASVASADAWAACSYGDSRSGPKSAAAYDSTQFDIEDCFAYGGSQAGSSADGASGTLSGWANGSGYYGIDASWGSALTSDIKFLSNAASTSVTFHIDGAATSGGDEYAWVSLDEGLYLHLTGAFGVQNYSWTVYDTVAQDLTFTFTGHEADVHVTFGQYGYWEVSNELGGYGTADAKLSITTSSGAFFAERNFFGAVPEPSSWAMILGGFGMIGGAMRYRRKNAVSFA